jgi:hypothetical protein
LDRDFELELGCCSTIVAQAFGEPNLQNERLPRQAGGMTHTTAAGTQRQQRRDRGRKAFWLDALSRQRQCGLGVRAFCAREGLREATFYRRRREVGRRDAPAFVELRPAPPAEPVPATVVQLSDAPVELVFPQGPRVLVRPGCDAALLRRVLAALVPEVAPC